MKISIVTISFNQARYLRECIDSVLSQKEDRFELEYIVVDPGSSDGSRELIESYGDSIIRVFDLDNGPADGLSKGFSKATGDIFGFLNSDDYLLPGALRNVHNHYNNTDLNHFVTGGGYIDRGVSKNKVYPSQLSLYRYLVGASTVFQQGTFFPGRLYKKVGGFNTSNTTCWDGELFANFLAAGHPHCVIRSELAGFRLHPDSISGSGRLEELYLKDNLRMFKLFLGREPNAADKLLNLFFRIEKRVHFFANRVKSSYR